MDINYDIEKLSKNNHFGLWKVKMEESNFNSA